jgi:hypothetical protein
VKSDQQGPSQAPAAPQGDKPKNKKRMIKLTGGTLAFVSNIDIDSSALYHWHGQHHEDTTVLPRYLSTASASVALTSITRVPRALCTSPSFSPSISLPSFKLLASINHNSVSDLGYCDVDKTETDVVDCRISVSTATLASVFCKKGASTL